MKKNYYVFCHGFGFDASFWNHLKPYFEGEETFYCDLGYFGERRFPSKILTDQFNYIAIGHSFGLIALLDLPIPWSCVLGLNGFVDFLGNEPVLKAARLREWTALQARLKRSPMVTLSLFYKRVGVLNTPAWEAMDEARLQEDLERLVIPPPPSSFNKMILLSAKDDVVVPPSLIEDNLKRHSEIRLDYVDEGKHALGHALPHVVSSWCRQYVAF